MEIKVKRFADGKIFSNIMFEEDTIIEIHFSTSYTQVVVQESIGDGEYKCKDIICPALGANGSWVDNIAIQDSDFGEFIK